jgi:hypothetical protein
VFYQLLGGYFPYDEAAWLSKRERIAYSTMTSAVDRTIYAKECISKRIVSDKMLDYATIPFWVPKSLKDVVKKACRIAPNKRLQSAADFMAELHKAKSVLPNWSLEDGILTMTDTTSYRLVPQNVEWAVEKKAQTTWRKDNSFGGMTKAEIVDEINHRRLKKS